jgi:hypothetical protein
MIDIHTSILYSNCMTEKDITGKTFGRLTAIKSLGRSGRNIRWLFTCECGSHKSISKQTVVSGAVRSCGCLHLERCASGLNRRRHGDAAKGGVTRLHNIWRGMVKRCKPDGVYGARGIFLCPEWLDYEPFRDWSVANGYGDNLTIDRIDNSGDYSPENCRWADVKRQCRNRRTTVWITMDGTTQSLADWLEHLGVSRDLYRTRRRRGWDPAKSLITPKRGQ